MFISTPTSWCWASWKHLAFIFTIAGMAASADAQLLYSFETDDEGFVEASFGNAQYISHNQFTGNATDGTGSLQVEIQGTGFSRNIEIVESNNGIDPKTANYDVFNTVAADPGSFNFEYDVIFDSSSWTGLSDPGTFFHSNVFSNSGNATFTDQFGIIDVPSNSVGTFSASIPASSLSLGLDSDFFQLIFGNNGDATPGGGGEGLVWYLDNVRFSPVAQFNEQLLFSFETPDDPGTPSVNEQFEGWTDGFAGNTPHVRSITAGPDGVTDGASALAVTAPGEFTWGSQFELDAGVDPTLQSDIDMMIADFNSAERLAIDVTFPDDQFPNEPSFLTVFASVSDQNGAFFEEQQQAGNPGSAAGSTVTLFFDMDQFVDNTTNEVLSVDGLQAGTFFRLALATNSDEEVDFTIDNIRLLSSPLEGDFNGDGSVDAADYTVWRDNLGSGDESSLSGNGDGMNGVDAGDYTLWANNFGATSSSSSSSAAASAVPEPGTALLGVISCLSLIAVQRRK